MNFYQSVYTDIGTHRKTNQDSAGIFKASTDRGEVLLAMVCDGMGGYENGEVASKVLIEAFEKWFKYEFPYEIYDTNFTYEELFKKWGRIIYECNEKLVKYGMDHGISLGSTLTAMLLMEDEYYMAHVGDSRAYVITHDQVFQMTRDQSVVAEAVRRGEITPEQAKSDRRRNMLLECIGVTPDIQPLFYTGKFREKDTFLLCSDGFWHNLTDDELVRYMNGSQFNEDKEIYMHLNYLIEQDKTRGEKDNITAAAVVPYRERTEAETGVSEEKVQETASESTVCDRTEYTNPVNASDDELLHIRIDPDPEDEDMFPPAQSAGTAAGIEQDESDTSFYVSPGSPVIRKDTDSEQTKTISGRFYIMLEAKEVRASADCSILG